MESRILIAGIGNIFLGDDGFGVEVVRRLAERELPRGVVVRDFGIRGMDLVYALMDEYDAVVFADIAPRGGAPGTLYLMEVQPGEGEVSIDTHGMDPVKVLGLARALGARPIRTYVVGCEPSPTMPAGDDPDVVMELSEPLLAAIPEAVAMVEALIMSLRSAAPCRTTGLACARKGGDP